MVPLGFLLYRLVVVKVSPEMRPASEKGYLF
jgi:hypothetical protein